jgi:hypothetical protein
MFPFVQTISQKFDPFKGLPGESVTLWIADVHSRARRQPMSHEMYLSFIEDNLAGSAKQWYRGAFPDGATDGESILDALKEFYVDKSEILRFRTEFKRCTQSGLSVREYASKKSELAAFAGLSLDQPAQINSFLDGLDFDIQLQLFCTPIPIDFATWNFAIRAAVNVSSGMERIKRNRERFKRYNRQSSQPTSATSSSNKSSTARQAQPSKATSTDRPSRKSRRFTDEELSNKNKCPAPDNYKYNKWCDHHGRWLAHTTENCRLARNNRERDNNSGDRQSTSKN